MNSYGMTNIVPTAETFLINNAENYNTFKTTEMYEISRFFCKVPFTPIFEEINPIFFGKRILLLVPGFTSTEEQVLEAVLNTAEKVHQSYDVVIGYVYPSGKGLQYGKARGLAKDAAQCLSPILDDISYCARKVDIVAHSMGAYVTFNTLQNKFTRQPVIDNLFLLGGADRQESLYNCYGPSCTTYTSALKNVNVIFNLLTCSDQALPFHTLLIGQNTLGNPVKWNIDLLAAKVKIIDTSAVVKGHSGFLTAHQMFDFINWVAQGNSLSEQSYKLVGSRRFATNSPAVCEPKVAQVIRTLAQPIIGVARFVNAGLNSLVHDLQGAFSS